MRVGGHEGRWRKGQVGRRYSWRQTSSLHQLLQLLLGSLSGALFHRIWASCSSSYSAVVNCLCMALKLMVSVKASVPIDVWHAVQQHHGLCMHVMCRGTQSTCGTRALGT
jgi:hypothetical protein